jgi:hypothetical protein
MPWAARLVWIWTWPNKRCALACSGAKDSALVGWRAKTFGRGMQGHKPFFHVIEFWLENRLMIEVVSPAMLREYEDFLKGAQMSVMSDPESLRLMRATHINEPA